MVILEIQFEVEEDERERLLDVLRSLPDRIRAESGCLSCTLAETDEETGGISLLMNWRNAKTYLAHRRGRNYSVLDTAMNLLHYKPRTAMSFGGDTKDLDALLGAR